MRRKKLGFLGGSFDPLHFGHLNMALSLLEAHALDSVLFCPTYISPFKTASPPIAHSEHRLQMVLLGIQKIEQFTLLDWEITKNAPSFTLDTMKRLRSESDAEFFLLLGEDQLTDLHKWKEVEELLALAHPLIAIRENNNKALDHLYRNNPKNREFDKEASQNSHLERATIVCAQDASEDKNFEKKLTPSKTDSSGCFGISPSLHKLIDKGRTVVPMMDISSTVIRKRLAHKQFCGHLVPHLILDYIKHHHLYS